MGCVHCIPERRIAVIERFGKFDSMAKPGVVCIPAPCICSVAGVINMQMQQLNVKCESKTKDNVFVTLVVAVQYEAIPEKVYEAFYRLSSPANQINSFVFDVVRASVPTMELDELFLNKAKIANDVQHRLSELMNEYGFRIRDCLVIDIDPDQAVKAAMNEINANRRLRIAAQEKAEAEKIMVVKKAEAEAESKYLNGVGIAKQQQAIIEGQQNSAMEFASKLTNKDVLELLLITSHFDMVEHVGRFAKNSTLFLSHSPGSISDTANQIRKLLA